MRKTHQNRTFAGFCVNAALVMSLAACKAQQPGNEAKQSGNESQSAAIEKQPAARVAAVKCPNSYAPLPADATDLTRNVYACVERSALLFARGPDTADTLSKAVIVKCRDPISRYVDQEAKKSGTRPQYKEPLQSWQDHALLIIAEARARRCSN